MTDTLITPAADERDWADNLAAFLERDALKAGSWGSWGGDDGETIIKQARRMGPETPHDH